MCEWYEQINDNMVTMKEMVERYMNILKPSQQIAFLTWIEDNQACMYMLNSIWMNKSSSPHTENAAQFVVVCWR